MNYIPYKGKTKEDLWFYLDELEKLDLNMDSHTDIFDVMEEICKEPNGLRRIVERYSDTSSTLIFGYTVAALSHYAREITSQIPPDITVSDEIIEITFKLLQKSRWLVIEPDNLGGLLGTLQMIVWSGGWNKNIVPNTFAEIIQRCLKFGWINEKKAQNMKIDTLTLLRLMCEKKILTSHFNAEQIDWLRKEAHLFSGLDGEKDIFIKGLKKESLKLLECLENYDSVRP